MPCAAEAGLGGRGGGILALVGPSASDADADALADMGALVVGVSLT